MAYLHWCLGRPDLPGPGCRRARAVPHTGGSARMVRGAIGSARDERAAPHEVLMNDSHDRDRQQRELTEELRHDAEVRTARNRLEEEHQGAAPQAEAHTATEDQRQASCAQPLSQKRSAPGQQMLL